MKKFFKNVKKKRTGFTLVELLVVIAILAVLASVSVIGYLSFVKKAKVSNDSSLITQMNTTLQANEAVDGKNATAHDAIEELYESGLDVNKLSPTTEGYHYAIDMSQNRAFLLDGDYNKVAPENLSISNDKEDVFVMVGSYDQISTVNNEGYSVYLKNGFDWGAQALKAITTDKGIDVGENEVTTIKYENKGTAQNVKIRTNGYTKVEIDAPKDTVHHYDRALTIDITEIAGKSYHEHGEIIGNIEVTKGRVELESTADVYTILLKPAANNDVEIDVQDGASVEVVAPTTDAGSEYIKSEDSIPAESKVEEKVDTTKSQKFSGGGFGTEKNPYLISTVEDRHNINSLILETKEAYYYRQIADFSVDTYIENFIGSYDGGNYKLTATYKDSNMNYAHLFYKAIGHVSFKNINVTMSTFPVNILRMADWGTAYGADFENITFTGVTTESASANNFGLVVAEALYTKGDKTVIYNFKNIINYVSIENTSAALGFIIGSGPCFNAQTILNFENCKNYSDFTGTSYVGYLYGNPSYIDSINYEDSQINVVNCLNTGIFHATNSNGLSAFALKVEKLNEQYQDLVGGAYISGPGTLNNVSIEIHQEDTSFTISGDNDLVDYTFKLAFSIASTYHKADGTAWTESDLKKLIDNNYKADATTWNVANGSKYFHSLEVDESATSGHTKFHAYDKRTAKSKGFDVDNLAFIDKYSLVVKDNTTYIILDIGDYQYVDSTVSLIVYAYKDGKLKGTKSVN